ncbi:hypothetical protein BC939DRAFT_105870 [Gamsiella multidivaricata]|uniref:uncharacterized protein n=1 Tax=Gamsiella multidivaricata TaxID=101098 RepID=UPI00222127BF|nr:uncharacterized protein BC939DRAFT_105870 [Gamsiella multidivaricata]KAI7826861.1 hypothetical protein BC939DRAFT_105870 [Gamsiella multidivaricata]
MALAHMLPKDALVLCTVSVLFIYFGLILWTNFTIILPYWTPLFWAAALSVPLVVSPGKGFIKHSKYWKKNVY